MKPVRISVVIAVCSILLGSAASAQTFSVSPQALNFTYQIGGANPPAQTLYLSSATPSAQFSISISGAPWLSVSPAAGVAPSNLTVSASAPQNAVAGTLTGTIIIGPPGSVDAVKTVVAVTLQVLGAPQGELRVDPQSLVFDHQVGAPAPGMRAVTLTSTGSAAGFSLASTVPWASYSVSSLVTPAAIYITVTPLPTMGPGVYTGAIVVNPAYAGGKSTQIGITLRISSGVSLAATPTSLGFVYQPGGPSPTQQSLNVVNVTGGFVPFTANVVTANGGNWLSVSPFSASTPFNLLVMANPANLTGPATYSGSIILTPSNTANKTEIPVTLTVYSASQLVVDPASLAFSSLAGGAPPAHQYLSVKSTGPAVSFGVQVSGPSWITASTAGATTPTGFTVNALPPSSTAPGTYSASITLTPTTGGGNPVYVAVTAKVGAANYLTVGRTSVSFDAAVNGSNPPPVIVPVTSSGAPLYFLASAATPGQSQWLKVSQSNPYTPADLTITASPQGLAAGTYSGTIFIDSQDATNGQQQIAVTLNVAKATAFLATPWGLVFSAQIGGETPPPQLFAVSTPGGASHFSTKPETTTGGNWLTVIGQGATPATAAVGVNLAGLGVGTYTGRIVVTSDDPEIPPLEMPVVLNVSAAPVYLPGQTLAAFQYQVNGPTPPAQKIMINANTSDQLVYYPKVVTADGGAWLSVTPDVGVTASEVTISVKPAGMAPGLYYGLVAISDPAADSPTSFVPVTLQISNNPLLSVPSVSLVFKAAAGAAGTSSQSLPLKAAGQPTPYHASTSGGDWLRVNPADGYTDALLSVTTTADTLAVGYYLGLVTVEIPGSPNSQQYVPVVLVVSPAATPKPAAKPGFGLR